MFNCLSTLLELMEILEARFTLALMADIVTSTLSCGKYPSTFLISTACSAATCLVLRTALKMPVKHSARSKSCFDEPCGEPHVAMSWTYFKRFSMNDPRVTFDMISMCHAGARLVIQTVLDE